LPTIYQYIVQKGDNVNIGKRVLATITLDGRGREKQKQNHFHREKREEEKGKYEGGHKKARNV
jgi:hypothetical protein